MIKRRTTPVTAILDGYIPRSLLAKELNIPSRYLRCTSLEQISFKKVVLIKLPAKVVQLMQDGYISCIAGKDDDTTKYEYIFSLNRNTKIGFWK